MTEQADNLTAIDQYFHTQVKNTNEATNLFNQWVAWFNALGWYDKSFTQATYDEARNRRNAFDLANAQSDEEIAAIQERMKTGITSEEASGQVDRRDSSGNYILQKPPWVPTWIWYAGGGFIALVTGVTVVVAGKAVATEFAKRKF